MKSFCCGVAFALVLILSPATLAQDASDTVDHSNQMDHSGHDMGSGEMDHSQHMEHSGEIDHSGNMDYPGHNMDSDQMDHSEHAGHGATAATQVEMAVDAEELRDPHAYAEGEDFGPYGRIRLADQKEFGAVLIERFEAVDTDDNSWVAFDGQAWYGRTYDRANLQLEGEVDSGEIHELRTELLWSHAITPFWDT